MNTKRIETAEHVLPGHPDKLCDAVVDNIVDFVRTKDPLGQCGLEACCVFDTIHITGRIASDKDTIEKVKDNFEWLVRDSYHTAGYGRDDAGYVWGPTPESIKISKNLCLGPFESQERGNRHLSDDQAICIGYANNRHDTDGLPPAHWLSRRIARYLHKLRKSKGAGHVGPDGKVITRVEVDGDVWRPLNVSISLNHHDGSDWLLLREIAEEAVELACEGLALPAIALNTAGSFTAGGPNGDNGLSGKKLVVDAYGPTVPIGGGAWSGKDFNKVDRLGGLLARQLAYRFIQEKKASDALVTLEYVPGCDGPVSIGAIIDGKPIAIDEQKFLEQSFLKNKQVSRRFNQKEFNLTELARWGHQTDGVPWERIRSKKIQNKNQIQDTILMDFSRPY